MRVKAIMLPLEEVQCVSIDETIGDAIKKIDEYRLLTLPVVEGKVLKGVISKQNAYETFFCKYNCKKEEFLALKAGEITETKFDTVDSEMWIEEAAALFISSKVRFLPVIDEKGELEGIVSQQAVFTHYQKQFGSPEYASFTVLCYDGKGMLANVTDIIAKAGANIKNIVCTNADVMELQEFFFRVETQDFDRLLAAMEKNKLDVRNVRRGQEKEEK